MSPWNAQPTRGALAARTTACLLLALPGCRPAPPAAPISNHQFTPAQQLATREILREVGTTSPDTPRIPLDLVPEDGVRWSTIPAAVDHAVNDPSLEMAVISNVSTSQMHVLYLTNRFGWPTCVKVTRQSADPAVAVEVRCGPYPDQPAAQRRADLVRERVLDSIRHYGRLQRLPRYKVESEPSDRAIPTLR